MTHFIFDCDDVLLDWQTGFINYVEQMTGASIDRSGPKTWCLGEWIGCTPYDAKALVESFNGSRYFGQLRSTNVIRKLIYDLRDSGHTLHVLTACGDGRDQRRERYGNLRREFDLDIFGKNERNVHFLPLGSSKFTFLYEFTRNRDPREVVFVEDNFEHAKSGVANGIRSYCLRRSHNRQQEAENPDTQVIWIDDLDTIRLDFIPSIQPNVDEETDDRIGRCNRCGTALREEPDGWSDCPRCQGSY